MFFQQFRQYIPKECVIYRNAPPTTEAFVTSELERRFYLFLIGGGYERLFYLFSDENPTQEDDAESTTDNQILRIKLDVEVSKPDTERETFGKWADPEYKRMLDFMLNKRLRAKLESPENLLITCPQAKSLVPFLRTLGGSVPDEKSLSDMLSDSWLQAQVTQFVSSPKFAHLFDLENEKSTQEIVRKLGYPMCCWLVSRWLVDSVQGSLHSSLIKPFKRAVKFQQIMGGAISTLTMNSPFGSKLTEQDKWLAYCLSGINFLPLLIIFNLLNVELNQMLQQQKQGLGESAQDAKRQATIETYEYSGELLVDLLKLEEIIKPHLLENIEFTHFDATQYLLGVASKPHRLADIFFKARAYALYRLLFKTGRIRAQETAVFLKKHQIGKSILEILNEKNLADLVQHLQLLHDYLENTDSSS